MEEYSEPKAMKLAASSCSPRANVYMPEAKSKNTATMSIVAVLQSRHVVTARQSEPCGELLHLLDFSFHWLGRHRPSAVCQAVPCAPCEVREL